MFQRNTFSREGTNVQRETFEVVFAPFALFYLYLIAHILILVFIDGFARGI